LEPLLYISASCVIDQHIIYKDQRQIFLDDHDAGPNDFLTNAYKFFKINYPRFYKMDNLCKLGWLCTELLITGDNENGQHRLLKDVPPEAVTILLCNANSSLDTDHKYYDTVAQMASPALFVYTLPNIVMGEMSIRNGWKGENIFFVLDNFDPEFLMQQVQYLMKNEQNQACVCGWVELLGNEYKAALFLVERSNDGQNLIFTKENILKNFEPV
jgi:hypothetical protein